MTVFDWRWAKAKRGWRCLVSNGIENGRVGVESRRFHRHRSHRTELHAQGACDLLVSVYVGLVKRTPPARRTRKVSRVRSLCAFQVSGIQFELHCCTAWSRRTATHRDAPRRTATPRDAPRRTATHRSARVATRNNVRALNSPPRQSAAFEKSASLDC